MYPFVALSVFVLVTLSGVKSDQCSDCMNYDKCPPALSLALDKKNQETKQLFQAALCGYDRIGRRAIPKVCCSKFQPLQKNEGLKETAEDIRISNHPNMKLLPTSCGESKADRIHGGKEADLYEFPWMALISYRTRDGLAFKCGGSIINERYILTAAHCIQDKKVAGVRVGEYEIYQDYDCQNNVCESYLQDIPIEQSIIHENYHKSPSVVHDIALLRVRNPIKFGHRNVDTICLPKTAQLRNKPLANENAIVTGWGLTENGTESSILLKVKVPILTAQRCRSFFNRFSNPGDPEIINNQLCAGSLNKDSCRGDSGGPLMLEEKYNNVNRIVQYGIVSYGHEICGTGFPGVYTDVTKYMGWILDNMSP